MRTGIWFLLLLLSFPSHSSLLDKLTQSEPEFLPVEQAFPVTYSQTSGSISAHWETASGYYL